MQRSALVGEVACAAKKTLGNKNSVDCSPPIGSGEPSSLHSAHHSTVQASKAWLHALTDSSRLGTFGEVRQSEGQVKAEVLTEETGFQETYFLALGVGLFLLLILMLVVVVSTPRLSSRTRDIFRSYFTKEPELYDAEGLKIHKKGERSSKCQDIENAATV